MHLHRPKLQESDAVLCKIIQNKSSNCSVLNDVAKKCVPTTLYQSSVTKYALWRFKHSAV